MLGLSLCPKAVCYDNGMPINTPPDIHEIVVCANCFVRKDDKYLMLHRSKYKKYAPGVVHPVGGKVKAGEDPYKAAVREVYEETGLKVGNLRLEAVLLEIRPHLKEPYNWLIFHFSADFKGGDLKSTDEGEHLWLTEQEIIQRRLFPSLKVVIKYILNKEKGTVFATLKYDKQKQTIVEQKIDFTEGE